MCKNTKGLLGLDIFFWWAIAATFSLMAILYYGFKVYNVREIPPALDTSDIAAANQDLSKQLKNSEAETRNAVVIITPLSMLKVLPRFSN
jgi:hypothetical protein